jgi:xanthine/uracil/vitamin C permease (AzgA family)
MGLNAFFAFTVVGALGFPSGRTRSSLRIRGVVRGPQLHRVSFGVISYCLIALLSGRARKVSPILYVVAAMLLARYIFLHGG